MLFVLSPAKTLDYTTPSVTDQYSEPSFTSRSAELIDVLKKLSPAELGSLMKISDPLADLNAGRYACWSVQHTNDNAKQAVLAFKGDVYDGLDASSLTASQLKYVNRHVRILSGLYGILRPLDLMQPYRLEMGTRLTNPVGKNLYQFWDETVTKALNHSLAQQQASALINLASEEYFKVVQPKLLEAPVITPVFEDWKGERYKIISFYAKRARGMMARFAAEQGLDRPDGLKDFDMDGYGFSPEVSSETAWVFRRRRINAE